MKKGYLFAIALCLIISACKKDEINSNFDASYQSWQAFKKKSNSSYSYTAYNGSIFGGHAETIFTIKNDKIISRKYIAGSYKPNTDSLIISTTWTEDAATLNTHNNAGHELLTLDQVYNKAETEWFRVDPKENDIYFEAANAGLISTAGYVPKGCQDDCLTGIHIKDIKAL
ncbi:hypothetical protein [Mucilaginibacter glaciei]|uniref:Uncharacterized protein n=1 Tax=Mucilaginibacter glaciei TaxID=2772109 RepID=A0A926NMT2_9SPHI|nr:hypothetical protein [Mucilaginibacter glaciei]MBD1392088.1 hypothetical protein [Mucilaginibacter glaciei]